MSERVRNNIQKAAIWIIPPVALACWLDEITQKAIERAQKEEDTKVQQREKDQQRREEKQREKDPNFQQRREEKQRELLQRLIETHEPYSQAMWNFHRWRHQHGDPKKFREALEHNEKDALEVNHSRSLAKDYWRRIRHYCSEYGCSSQNVQVQDWKGQHRWFSLMREIEKEMEGYDDSDLYKWECIVGEKLVRSKNFT